MRHIIAFLLILFAASVKAQSGYMDNALNYNRLIREKTGEGVYKLIGNFKVVGTSFLFGEKNKGNIFSPEAKAYNIYLSYNTYNQEVDFYSSANPDKPLVKEAGTVDSFIINDNIELGINKPLKFVYATHIGATDKFYYQEIVKGKRFSLFKRYKSELGYVSANYIQSELRQFDLVYDYFYTDNTRPGVKRIKANAGSVTKEFKDVKDLSSVADSDSFSLNPEEAFRKVFDALNN
jgi:hypothetical protein